MSEYVNDNESENEEVVFENDEQENLIGLSSFNDTGVINFDFSPEMILSLYKKEKYNFNPDFQRRNVWDKKRKSKFIESVILNLPIPSILLAEDKKRNKYIIIDGKQRLNALIEFMDNDNEDHFVLEGLEVLKEINGYDYEGLSKDDSKSIYLAQFENFFLKTSVVKNYDEKLLYFIFARLNGGSVALSSQELRHTLFPGDFSKFINIKSSENNMLKKILRLKDKLDPRMRDAELLCRYYAFKYFLKNYDNNVGSILDFTYKTINDNWDNYKVKVENDLNEFNLSAKLIYDIFGSNSFKLYSYDEKKYLRFNRLVFDILIVLFSESDNRELVKHSDLGFDEFFKQLFDDVDFREAFMPTTSTYAKTQKRFSYLKEQFDLKYRG